MIHLSRRNYETEILAQWKEMHQFPLKAITASGESRVFDLMKLSLSSNLFASIKSSFNVSDYLLPLLDLNIILPDFKSEVLQILRDSLEGGVEEAAVDLGSYKELQELIKVLGIKSSPSLAIERRYIVKETVSTKNILENNNEKQPESIPVILQDKRQTLMPLNSENNALKKLTEEKAKVVGFEDNLRGDQIKPKIRVKSVLKERNDKMDVDLQVDLPCSRPVTTPSTSKPLIQVATPVTPIRSSSRHHISSSGSESSSTSDRSRPPILNAPSSPEPFLPSTPNYQVTPSPIHSPTPPRDRIHSTPNYCPSTPTYHSSTPDRSFSPTGSLSTVGWIPCKFWRRRNGCRNGNRCRFLHGNS
jgi:hypothetical protein